MRNPCHSSCWSYWALWLISRFCLFSFSFIPYSKFLKLQNVNCSALVCASLGLIRMLCMALLDLCVWGFCQIWKAFSLFLPPLTLGLWRHRCWTFCYFPTGPRGTVHFCFLLISLSCPDWANSAILSSSSLILFSVISAALLSFPSKSLYSVLHFHSTISLWFSLSFFNFYFVAEISHSFVCFKSIFNRLLKHFFYNACFKVLIRKSQLPIHLGVCDSLLGFLLQAVISWFLVWQDIFSMMPGDSGSPLNCLF